MLTLSKKKTGSLPILYLIGFLAALHFALSAYINSTFLETFIAEHYVGLIYTVMSVLAIFMLNAFPIFLNKLGNSRLFLLLITLEFFALLGLAFLDSAYLVIPIFIINQILVLMMVLSIDVFLETSSSDATTGTLRGAFLTAVSIAWVIGPLIAGFILTNGDFWKIYLTAAFVILPVFFLTSLYFKDFQDPSYARVPFKDTFKRVFGDKNIRSIFISSFLLRFFYAWMVIYTPIYLHQHIGFEWSTIGIIFFVMLLPFVIFNLPLGRVADKLLGEKELLTAGFIILAGFTAALSFTTSTNPAWWAFLLFGTRIGASFIDIMSETYFFKNVDSSDVNIISFFRNTGPLAYITAPVVATIALSFIDFKYLFLVLAVIVFQGIFYSLSIKDTR